MCIDSPYFISLVDCMIVYLRLCYNIATVVIRTTIVNGIVVLVIAVAVLLSLLFELVLSLFCQLSF